MFVTRVYIFVGGHSVFKLSSKYKCALIQTLDSLQTVTFIDVTTWNPSYKHEIELKTLVNRGTKPSSSFMNGSSAPLLFAGARC